MIITVSSYISTYLILFVNRNISRSSNIYFHHFKAIGFINQTKKKKNLTAISSNDLRVPYLTLQISNYNLLLVIKLKKNLL